MRLPKGTPMTVVIKAACMAIRKVRATVRWQSES